MPYTQENKKLCIWLIPNKHTGGDSLGIVNADANELLQSWNNIKTAITSIETTRSSIMRKYQQLNGEWKDKKYKELGDVVQECSKALNEASRILSKGEKIVGSLAKSLQEYEEVNLDNRLGNSYGSSYVTSEGSYSTNSNSNAFVSQGLTHTRQETTNVFLNGRNCTVFDHPFDENSGRICNQGSAYPTGPQNTCGCCSSGTVINKAGGNTNEHDIVAFAWNNGFCDNDGFTTANTISDILTSSGVPSSNTSGTCLENLATYVEQGHGVIIAVNARRFDPDLYRQAGGHAIVLESVIRDAQTNEILEYVVVDSNMTNSVDAVRRVDAHRLERAFSDLGNQSISTNNIIW